MGGVTLGYIFVKDELVLVYVISNVIERSCWLGTRYKVLISGITLILRTAQPPTRNPVLAEIQRWTTGWTIGVLGFDSRWGLGIFLFTTVSRRALGTTQPPIQWVQGVLSLGVKRPGREAGHSPPSSAEVKNTWSYTSTPNTSSWRGALLSTGTTLPLPLPLNPGFTYSSTLVFPCAVPCHQCPITNQKTGIRSLEPE
jgi:hypothetical protein